MIKTIKKFQHTPQSAAKAVRVLLESTIAKTWPEYFDGAHRANAYEAAKLVQEQVYGVGKNDTDSFKVSMLAVQEIMPELFAEYWENII